MAQNPIKQLMSEIDALDKRWRKEQPPLAPARCCAAVWKRDTYRYTGRGVNGFEMHYTEKRCEHKATHGLFCWQHQHGCLPKYEPQHNAEASHARPVAHDCKPKP